MAGLFTVKDKQTGQETDVFDVQPATIGGRATAKFLCYNTRLGRFDYFPAPLFQLVDGGGGIDPGVPVQSVYFDEHLINLQIGATQDILAHVTPADATNKKLTFISSNSAVVSVEETGDTTATLTAVAAGNVVIHAQSASGAQDDLEVSVAPAAIYVNQFDIIPDSLEIEAGTQRNVTVVASPNTANDRSFTVMANDPTIATGSLIAANVFNVQGVAPGTATFTVKANDAGGYTETYTATVTAIDHATVSTYTQLTAAAGNPAIKTIDLEETILLQNTVTVNHECVINGNGHALAYDEADAKDGLVINANNVTVNNLELNMKNDDAAWEGHYGIQVYNSTGVTLNNITSSGEDAGILINGSAVTMTGTINISDNEFGGIEVSKGSTTPNNSTLTVTNTTFVNNTETYTHPTVWVEDGQGSIIGGTMFTEVAKPDLNQTHYYIDPANATE